MSPAAGSGPAGAGPALTRSVIEGWQTQHLSDAASWLRGQVSRSRGAFDELHRNVRGTEWAGDAKDAAVERVAADVSVVNRQGVVQEDAAAIAEQGAGDVQAAKRDALEAISEAEDDGFTVAEDLSVTDTRRVDLLELGARHASMKAHAENIRWRGEQLVQTDALVGRRLAEQAAELDGIQFDGYGRGGIVQAVDFGGAPLPEYPPSYEPKPWDYNLDLTTDEMLNGASAGKGITIDEVWQELHRCFNCNFPMGGAPKEFPKVGDDLPLEIRTFGVKLGDFSVRVTQVEKTASEINIEFVTLPGHVDGPGSTIHFKFFERDGELHLGINAHVTPDGPGTGPFPTGPLARAGYTAVARITWQPYIDNLVTNIQQSHGNVPDVTRPPVAPPGLPPIAVPNTGHR